MLVIQELLQKVKDAAVLSQELLTSKAGDCRSVAALFNDFIKVPFEDGMFYVPSEYDKILTQEYNNYITLPPVEKRIYQHEYKAYKK